MMHEADQHPVSDGGVDPAAWGAVLAEAYRAIGERTMRELPIYNDALGVEPVGFRIFNGRIVGIMITPWFMNVVVPASDASASVATPGSSLRFRFPTGEIDFTVSDVAPVGRIASCSLFSPMSEFADMGSARAVAEAAIEALMQPAADDEAESRRAVKSSIDRRSFLRGALKEQRG
ncbi:MAG: [NiFe]-hydrogenase assembly chaperone HybE [Bradyrhizobium sp.]|uniref:[NiFe]-hydrogenase assembly chaperone HybE n=1 Tax=Bradyrhizobium sp. TaxID=376 RepID=UPI0025C6B685|nr:[NiFe]-hydrogenase assembly chaperone HybE [Bradyrhizobium sp.]MBI5260618.1 [NiFe]-hydrogenase assembly chaperone HybE [Bradyrhizobium sp.]